MSTVEAAIVALAKADAAVAALVGARVYPQHRPQGTALPALVYRRIAGQSGKAFDGPDGMTEARVEVEALAATYGEAKGLSEAFREAFARFDLFVAIWNPTPLRPPAGTRLGLRPPRRDVGRY